ncbi:MAG: hypothetical protein HY744_31670 [Deltaproteobacteria bacterium]|nr:hypothetical protein [Deltaproteobacteria bacterium]
MRLEPADLTEPAEYRADLVVLLLDGKPVLAIIVEVQLAPDEDKRLSWPLYLAGLRARLRCPVCLLVVAPRRAVARWCARPIALGHPGFVLRPLVLGPDAVPLVTAVEQAAAAPELAVLSALAHGSGAHAVQVALAALGAIQGLDDERARFYLDLVMASLGEAARQALEAVMASGTYEYQSDFAKRYVAKGRAEGEAKGKAEAVVAVLEARGLDVPAALRQRLGGCTDLAQLDEWLRRAVTVASAAELLG